MEELSPSTAAVKASFDARANNMDTDRWRREVAERLVEFTPLQLGDRVLDAATGTGVAAIAAGRVVGVGGLIVGVDISDGMIGVAQRGMVVLPAPVEFRVGDATVLKDFRDGSFDAVICSASMIYLPAHKALVEWRRLLKPGGVVAFSTFAAGFPKPAAVFRDCFREVTERTLRDPAGVVGEPERCRRLLEMAGFEHIQSCVESVRFIASDLEQSFEINLHSPLHAIGTLDDQQASHLRQRYEERMNELLATEPEAATCVAVVYASGVAA